MARKRVRYRLVRRYDEPHKPTFRIRVIQESVDYIVGIEVDRYGDEIPKPLDDRVMRFSQRKVTWWPLMFDQAEELVPDETLTKPIWLTT